MEIIKFDEYIKESVNDKPLFKAFFIIGSPAAGKTTIIKSILLNTGDNLKCIDVDRQFEYILRKVDIHMDMSDGESEEIANMRERAKYLTRKQYNLYLNSMLPIVIDGTGRIKKDMIYRNSLFQSLGYDTYMIFIDTSLDIALKRNKKRYRILPEEFIKKTWYEVQNNIKDYVNIYGDNFITINNDQISNEYEIKMVGDKIKKLLNSPLENKKGQEIIEFLIKNKKKYLSDFDSSVLNVKL